MPSRSQSRSCVHEPPNQREATISTSPPRAAAAACSGVTTGRSTPPAGPAPCGRPTRPPKLWITLATEFPVCGCATSSNTPEAHPPRTANCHEEQLDERYRADNRAQAEHIGTKLAEIDAVIVSRGARPAADHVRRGTAGRRRMLARMQHHRWMAARKQAGVPTARNGPPERIPTCDWDAESANTRRRRTACSCWDF